MALPASGAISLNDIAGEFGGSVPHSINEYYGKASGIPGSGQISFSHFHGKSNIISYSSAANFTRSTNFEGFIGQDIIKVNSSMGVAPQDQPSTYTWNGINTGNCQGTIGSSWYCPNISQLEILYSNRDSINNVASQSFPLMHYWSSTDYNSSWARYVGFYFGSSGYDGKGHLWLVRCVRSF
jgi:hypothetical protein